MLHNSINKPSQSLQLNNHFLNGKNITNSEKRIKHLIGVFGGAVLIEGKLLRGKHFQAGCLAAHSTINFSGKLCNCGNIGCVESEASTWRLPSLSKNHYLFLKS